MEVFGHFLLGLFVALIIFAAITFGFMLLAWFIAFAITISLLVMLRGWIRRWWFLYVTRDQPQPKKKPKVIDAEYRDISDRK